MRALASLFGGIAILLLTAASLTSCGRPDASGIYVAASDRNVTLVQLVENKDGVLTGRLEQVTAGPTGAVSDQSTNLDGAASKHDLMLKPTSAWFGGLTATGSFGGDEIKLIGKDFSLTAPRSSLDAYQTAVAHLQSVAATDRHRLASAQAVQAAQAAHDQAMKDLANRTQKIEVATDRLRADISKLNSEVEVAPDFGQRSAMNTARVERMMRIAPTLNAMKRNQLIVAANQVVVGTNQIEVARSQYAVALNQIVDDAGPIAQALQTFCSSAEAAQYPQYCADAKATVADYTGALTRGREKFIGYQKAVRSEMDRQNEMIQRMSR